MTPVHVVGPDRKVVDVLCGRQEQHISADIAYAVWHYWLVSGDEGFLIAAGAELLLETGRFWASRVQIEADGRGHSEASSDLMNIMRPSTTTPSRT